MRYSVSKKKKDRKQLRKPPTSTLGLYAQTSNSPYTHRYTGKHICACVHTYTHNRQSTSSISKDVTGLDHGKVCVYDSHVGLNRRKHIKRKSDFVNLSNSPREILSPRYKQKPCPLKKKSWEQRRENCVRTVNPRENNSLRSPRGQCFLTHSLPTARLIVKSRLVLCVEGLSTAL